MNVFERTRYYTMNVLCTTKNKKKSDILFWIYTEMMKRILSFVIPIISVHYII